jgi:lipopolysaccharide/colanic/teichoic acid biosynthesis glycosyltransferase
MLKRSLDLVLALLAIVVLSPVLLPVVIALLLTGEHEVFYAQARVGRFGKQFPLFKFVTMLRNSPNMAGGDITSANDPRVLPLGRILRSTKINELPQLLNIVVGDMSLIGYRPLTPRVAALFPKEYWATVGQLRPGLSGIGSIVFRDEEELLAVDDNRDRVYADVIVPHKSALELWYLRHQSFLLDIKLMTLTIAVVFAPGLDVTQWLPDLPAAPPALQSLRQQRRRKDAVTSLTG